VASRESASGLIERNLNLNLNLVSWTVKAPNLDPSGRRKPFSVELLPRLLAADQGFHISREDALHHNVRRISFVLDQGLLYGCVSVLHLAVYVAWFTIAIHTNRSRNIKHSAGSHGLRVSNPLLPGTGVVGFKGRLRPLRRIRRRFNLFLGTGQAPHRCQRSE